MAQSERSVSRSRFIKGTLGVGLLAAFSSKLLGSRKTPIESESRPRSIKIRNDRRTISRSV